MNQSWELAFRLLNLSQDVEHLCYYSATTYISVQKWETKERGKTKLVGFKRVQLFKTGNKPEWVTAAPDVACGLSTLRAPLVGSENNLCTFGAANVPLHSWLSFSCSGVMISRKVESLQMNLIFIPMSPIWSWTWQDLKFHYERVFVYSQF